MASACRLQDPFIIVHAAGPDMLGKWGENVRSCNVGIGVQDYRHWIRSPTVPCPSASPATRLK
jgi:hypothetical protein